MDWNILFGYFKTLVGGLACRLGRRCWMSAASSGRHRRPAPPNPSLGAGASGEHALRRGKTTSGACGFAPLGRWFSATFCTENCGCHRKRIDKARRLVLLSKIPAGNGVRLSKR